MFMLPIIVLYKRKLEESESVNSLLTSHDASSISEIFVYNNSPDIVSVPEQYMGVTVHKINDYKNSGVSKAYNEGIKIAKQLKYQYVLLLDQDTSLPENVLDVYKQHVVNNPEIKLFCPILKTFSGAICSPLVYKLHRGFQVKHFDAGEYNFDKFSPINSGMLLNVDAALECGGYNEDVFLDFSDFQFIERFKKHNSSFYVVPLIFNQDFSGDELDVSKLLVRFKLYCKCARKCSRDSVRDDFIYFAMVFTRATKLAIKTRKVHFYTNFYKYYIRG